MNRRDRREAIFTDDTDRQLLMDRLQEACRKPTWQVPARCFMDKRLRGAEFAHSLVEGRAEDLDKERNAVAGQVALSPAPTALFEDEPRISQTKK